MKRACALLFAGARLYPSEDDYSGLGALDPNNPDVLYISNDADSRPARSRRMVAPASGDRLLRVRW
jgi:hypothetical protein